MIAVEEEKTASEETPRISQTIPNKHVLALSTNWSAARHFDGEAMLLEIRDLGFEYVELGHTIRYSLWPGIKKAIEDGVVRVTSLHNFCPLPISEVPVSCNTFEYTHPRRVVRDAAVYYTKKTIEAAAEVGAAAVVLHAGSSSRYGVTQKLEKLFREGKLYSREYCKLKLQAVAQRRKEFPQLWKRVKDCLLACLEHAEKYNVRLGIESRSHYEEFPTEEEYGTIFEEIDSPFLGYWHDFGHLAGKEHLGFVHQKQFLNQYANRLIGAHFQDCRPPGVDHLPLGKGTNNFQELLSWFPENYIAVLELTSRSTADDIVASHKLWATYENI
jgi:sugar phosphate isomerase/epimerase